MTLEEQFRKATPLLESAPVIGMDSVVRRNYLHRGRGVPCFRLWVWPPNDQQLRAIADQLGVDNLVGGGVQHPGLVSAHLDLLESLRSQAAALGAVEFDYRVWDAAVWLCRAGALTEAAGLERIA